MNEKVKINRFLEEYWPYEGFDYSKGLEKQERRHEKKSEKDMVATQWMNV